MNEQIRLLAKQARENSVRWGVYTEEEFYEKFAELIVAECGVALSPMLRDMVSRGQAFDLIKRHFGVEE